MIRAVAVLVAWAALTFGGVPMVHDLATASAARATMEALGKAEGKEVKMRNKNRLALAALVACWAAGAGGCAAPDPVAMGFAAGDAGGLVRSGPEAGAAGGDPDAALLDLAAAPDMAPPPDTGPIPVNVYEPLPEAGAAWLATLGACESFRVVATMPGGVWTDRCEGLVRNGVRCVECVGFADGKPLPATCRTSGACEGAAATALVCVADCHAECERAPRFCGKAVAK